MARRISKRKEPSKEEYLLKERLKISEGVFDTPTLIRIGKLFSLGIISQMHFKIASGKESDIYLAAPGPKVNAEVVVLKIYRIETTSFRDRLDYILGDPRFNSVKRDMHAIVNLWCRKEFSNLQIAHEAHANAPEPYDFNGNVLAMEFIGTDGMPSPRLKDVELKSPDSMLKQIIEQVAKLYANGLVHADLSEYNVLVKNDVPYLIDFGQAIVTEHPKAKDFLRRDIANIASFFQKKYAIKADVDEMLDKIVK